MLVYRGFSHAAPGPTVLTIGNFDGIHQGHRALLGRLTASAASGQLLPAVLTFEPHPREYFAPESAPARLSTLREKLELIADEGVAATWVCRFNARFAALSAEEFIARVLIDALHVKHLIIGDDFCFGADRTGDFALLADAGKRHGFVVEAIDSVTVDGLRASSSAVRAALAAGQLDLAARLLGRPYSIDGRVVRGEQIGRQLGFATANIRIKHDKPPLLGVFAVEVSSPGFAGSPFKGVANLGFRPSLNKTRQALLEVHLFDFAGDLYGTHLNVRFRHQLRDEMKFPNLDALKMQIATDIAEAKAFFTAKARRREGREESAE